MSKVKEMRSQLSPLNLYSLSGGSLVNCELQAYDAALTALQNRIDGLLNSLWVATADENILSLWEQRLGFCGEGTADERRKRILSRLQRNNASSFTMNGIDDYLDELGCIGTMINDFNNLSARIYARDTTATPDYFIPYVKFIRDVVPTHLQVTIEVLQENWNQTDARNYDFDRWDSMELHWDVNWDGKPL